MHVKIEVTLMFSTPFNVGTGALAGTVADKPMLKDAWRVPYVPGSSFKGKLRHECEKIVRALTETDDTVCYSPNADTMCPQRRPPEDPYCPVCRVFGSPWYPAPFTFSDLRLRDDLYGFFFKRAAALKTRTRFGVGISRRRGVAQEDLLYTTEVWPQDLDKLVFTGCVEGEIASRRELWQVALILAGMRSLYALGGGKSRGMGWSRVQAANGVVKLNGQEEQIKVREELERWLGKR
ncbi:MAG: hypothetical protein ISS50_02295 [Anaerolineae bacterium]|nr:hypothetical protein [Anaerolineae bacterium]